MANKNSTMILIDVSSGMGKADSTNEKVCRLDSAKKVVLDFLHQKLKEAKKTAKFAVALIGADDVDDNKEESKYGVKLLHPFGVAELAVMRDVANLKPSTRQAVDLTAAVTFAAAELDKHVKHYKISKHVFVISAADYDGAGASFDLAVDECNSKSVNLNMIFVDCKSGGPGDDEVNGVQAAVAAAANPELSMMCRHLSDEVRKEYEFQSKSVSGAKKALLLRIGGEVKLHVEVYAKVVEEKPPSLKKISQLADTSQSLGKVSMDRVYRSKSNPDVELGPEDRTKGYMYGKSIVPFAATDEVAMAYTAEKGVEVLGSVKAEDINCEQRIGAVKYMVANPMGPKSVTAFAALVEALHRADRALLARYLDREGSPPKLMALVPSLDQLAEKHCMYLVQLPVDEDVRHYDFDSVDDPKLTPSAVQMKSARELVARMSFEDQTRFQPEQTYNPSLAYLYHCIRERALIAAVMNGCEAPLPSLPESIRSMVSNTKEEVESAKEACEAFAKAFPLKSVGSKRKTKEFWGSLVKEKAEESKLFDAVKKEEDAEHTGEAKSGADAWFSNTGASKVDSVQSVDPVGSFNAMLMRKDKDMSMEAVEGMVSKIKEFVGPDGGSLYYPKAKDCLIALRQGCLKCSQEPEYNTFLHELKEALLTEEENEFWDLIVQNKITLITNEECNTVDDTPKDADNFLLVTKSDATVSTAPEANQQDDDDLFDDME